MEKNELFKIAKKFDVEGNPVKIETIDVGHINKTYLVEYDNTKKYILQYVNTNVFCRKERKSGFTNIYFKT